MWQFATLSKIFNCRDYIFEFLKLKLKKRCTFLLLNVVLYAEQLCSLVVAVQTFDSLVPEKMLLQ